MAVLSDPGAGIRRASAAILTMQCWGFLFLNHKAVTAASSTQIQVAAAGRVHCRVHDVSCLADLAPELSTLVRLRHQLNWYHKGCQPSCNALMSLFSTAHFLLMKSDILTWLSFFTFILEPVNGWPECCWPSSQRYSLVHCSMRGRPSSEGRGKWAGALGSVRAELGRLQGLLADYSIESHAPS